MGATQQAPTQALVDFTVGIRFQDLPKPMVKKTKEVILDSIGCALGAYAIEKTKIALEFVTECGGSAAASIIGNGKTSAPLAAFANGEMINALDFDPAGPLAGHVAPYVFPSCLAAAERVHASGKDLITATALALEIGGRVMGSVLQHRLRTDKPPYYEMSPRYSHSPGVFGAVAGAAKLLKLSGDQVANAFGIAGVSTPVAGNTKFHKQARLPMVKYNSWAGWIAQLATVSALMAEKGFTGDTTVLDGEWGFWKMYGSPFFNLDVLLGRLGELWHYSDVRIKVYPVCGLLQAGVDAINKIMKENAIDPDKIEGMVIKIDPWNLHPSRIGTEVTEAMRAQLCNTYVFAVAAYYGDKPSPQWQMPGTINDPRIKALAEKIVVKGHPKAHELIREGIKQGGGKMPTFWGASAEITAGGKKFSAEVMAQKGSSGNPLTDKELEEKFRINASYSMLRDDKINRAIDMLHRLEQVEDIANLTSQLTVQ